MQNAKQGTLVAAVTLAVCLVIGPWRLTYAQDAIACQPTARAELAYQPLFTQGDALAVPAAGDSRQTEMDDLTWPQRIALLAKGRAQLEGGYSYLHDSAGGTNWSQHAVPDSLLRFGLTDRLELRLGWPGYVSNNTDDPAIGGGFTGTLDPNVGLLYDLWGQHGWIPQTAVLASLPLSLAGNPFALDSLQPLAELMYSWQTGNRSAITGRSGLAVFDTSGDNYTQFRQSLSLDVALTDRLGTFLSWDMLADHGSWNDTSQHMAGGGLSLLLTSRFAVSWRAAVGLNSAAPDFLNDIRFAYRF